MIYWLYTDTMCYGAGRYNPETGHFIEITCANSDSSKVYATNALSEIGLSFEELRRNILKPSKPEDNAEVVESDQVKTEFVLSTIISDETKRKKLDGFVGSGQL